MSRRTSQREKRLRTNESSTPLAPQDDGEGDFEVDGLLFLTGTAQENSNNEEEPVRNDQAITLMFFFDYPVARARRRGAGRTIIPIIISRTLFEVVNRLNIILEGAMPRSDSSEYSEFLRRIKKRQKLRKILKEEKPYVYAEGMPPKECVICLADFKPKDKIRKLECEHEFHRSCVDSWLLKGGIKCPICRVEPFCDNKET